MALRLTLRAAPRGLAYMQGAAPLSLQQRCARAHGVTVGDAAPTAANAANAAARLGEYVTAARVWPQPKLPKDGVQLSHALATTLGGAGVGAFLRIFPTTLAAAAGGATNRAPLAVSPAATLTLRVRWQPPLPTTCQPSSPSSAFSSSTHHSASVVPLTPQTPQTSGAASAPSTPSFGSEPSHDDADSSSAEVGAWVAAAMRAGESKSPHFRMLQALAQRQLAQRVLLVGNLVTLPLLGRECVCEVLAGGGGENNDNHASEKTQQVSSSASSGVAGTVSDTASATAHAALKVANNCIVTLLVGDAADDPAAAAAAAAAKEAEETTEAAAADVVRRASVPTTAPSLGGVDHHVSALRELVTIPLTHPQLFTRCGLRPPRGVLLHGPPGTGKTSLARRAALDAGARLFVVNGPELISEHYGASETALREVFVAAAASGRAVVLLDELDALAPTRGGERTGGGSGGGGGGAGGDEISQVRVRMV
jgi:hypothetical protein